jgi:IclR family KDG regulon transcriptional repressor
MTEKMKASGDYSIRVVERAVLVLDALSETEHQQTLSEVAARTGLSIPTTFRLLRTLQDRGLVISHGPDPRYSLGSRILHYAEALQNQLDIVKIAEPYLAAARDEVDETVCLAVRNGDYYARVARTWGSKPLRVVTPTGEVVPLYAGAKGKVLLAAASDDEIEAYLARTDLIPFGPNTVIDPVQIRHDLREIRQSGFSETHDERGRGGVGIAAPVRDRDGRVVAAFGIAGPLSHITPTVRETWIHVAVSFANRISEALGVRTVPRTVRTR